MNINISPKCKGNFGDISEIMGKYSMLHENLWGLKRRASCSLLPESDTMRIRAWTSKGKVPQDLICEHYIVVVG